MMAQLSDAFIALPGGFGTLEELFEVATWTQLNYHDKPVGLLNVAGFFDLVLAHLEHAAEEGFIRPIHHTLLQHAKTPEVLLDRLAEAEIPHIGRWIDRP
ncbi:MAG: LOG family protein, partial [Deltaproteobacteria bacterium]|nr:LOG family protein [Deltaproteobacteria bacterium]